MTTHTECERESDWETQDDALFAPEPTMASLAMRRRAYDAAVAQALLEERDEERAERLELVEAAQALIMQAYLAHQSAPDESSELSESSESSESSEPSDAQKDEYATSVHSS